MNLKIKNICHIFKRRYSLKDIGLEIITERKKGENEFEMIKNENEKQMFNKNNKTFYLVFDEENG